MKLKIAWIGKTKDPAIQSLTTEYLKRISRYAEVEGLPLADEGALLKLRDRSRPVPSLALLDSRGKQLHVWDLDTGKEVRSFPHPTGVWCVATGPT